MLKNLNLLVKRSLETEVTIKKSWSKKMIDKLTFLDGKLVQMDLGKKVTVFIHHKSVNLKSKDEEGKVISHEAHSAYAITCAKPISYASLVNAAEQQEYNIAIGEMEAINRKGRKDPKDPLVVVHDEFIEWVEEGLKAIGMK